MKHIQRRNRRYGSSKTERETQSHEGNTKLCTKLSDYYRHHGISDFHLCADAAGLADACGAGLLYAAIYYRGGSIWVLILNHFMTDAASLFTTLFTVTEATAASAVNDLDFGNLFPLFISTGIAIFLLRKSKIHEAVEMLNNDYDAANR